MADISPSELSQQCVDLSEEIQDKTRIVAEYEIAGRRLKTIPIPDLLKLRDRYRQEVRAQSGSNGSGRSGRIYLRF